MSKREAVPKHSLPPQKQILSYMGRFINCPYAPDTDGWQFLFCALRPAVRTARLRRFASVQLSSALKYVPELGFNFPPLYGILLSI